MVGVLDRDLARAKSSLTEGFVEFSEVYFRYSVLMAAMVVAVRSLTVEAGSPVGWPTTFVYLIIIGPVRWHHVPIPVEISLLVRSRLNRTGDTHHSNSRLPRNYGASTLRPDFNIPSIQRAPKALALPGG